MGGGLVAGIPFKAACKREEEEVGGVNDKGEEWDYTRVCVRVDRGL